MGGISSMRSIKDEISVAASVLPQSAPAGTINGAAIDRYAFSDPQSAVIHHMAGAVSGAPTAVSIATVLQDSPDGASGWANVASVPAPAALTAANTEANVGVDLSGARRYLRLVTTVGFTGGTSPAAVLAADVIMGGVQEMPAV